MAIRAWVVCVPMNEQPKHKNKKFPEFYLTVTSSEKRQLPTEAQNVSRTFSATNSGENKQVSVLVNIAVNSGMDKVSGDGDSEAKQIVIRDASSCTFKFHFE